MKRFIGLVAATVHLLCAVALADTTFYATEAVGAGDVLVQDATADRGVKKSAVQGQTGVIGVAATSATGAGEVYVRQHGGLVMVNVAGAVDAATNPYLRASSTAGAAEGVASMGVGVFAIATKDSAGGQCEATLLTGLQDGGGSGGGAPADAAYITQTEHGGLSNEQALAGLADGLLKHGSGVVARAVPGTDYAVTKEHVGLGNVENLKVNLTATTNPGANDDNTQGYAVGSRWVNTTSDNEYVCVDASTGAAVWTETTATGGGGTSDHSALTNLNWANTGHTFDTNLDIGAYDFQSTGSFTDGTNAVTAANAKAAYDHSQGTGSDHADVAANTTHRGTTTGNPHDVSKSDVGLGNVENLKVNLTATTDPTVNDDTGDGYAVGSRWVNVSTDKEYVCLDASTGAAVWTETTALPGGSFVDRGDPSAWDFTSLTADETWRDLDLSSIVPEDATAVLLRTLFRSGSAADTVKLRENGNTNEINIERMPLGFGNSDVYRTATVAVDSNRVIEYWLTNTTWTTTSIGVAGWWLDSTGGSDADAIHDNVAGEIAAITEKTAPVADDMLLIEDSADSNNKKMVKVDNIPRFVDRGDPSAYDLDLASMTADDSFHDWDVSGVVPAGAKAVVLVVHLRGNDANLIGRFRKNGNTDTYAVVIGRTQAANVVMNYQVTVPCDTNRVIEYALSASGLDLCNITIIGWHF